MLLTAGLVSVKKSNQVHCSCRIWDTFLAKGDIPNYNQQKTTMLTEMAAATTAMQRRNGNATVKATNSTTATQWQ